MFKNNKPYTFLLTFGGRLLPINILIVEVDQTFDILASQSLLLLIRLLLVKDLILGKLQTDLPQHLTYHNIDHTLDVLQAANFLADAENIGETEKELLLTAAVFHDSGFIKTREEHEAESCRIARYYLGNFGYTDVEIEVVCDLIRATQIPQTPANKLEEILCDADLDYLGRDDFSNLSCRLFDELRSEGIVRDEGEWNREQADFMGAHSYFTQTAVNLRQQKKEQHRESIRSKISNQVFNENR